MGAAGVAALLVVGALLTGGGGPGLPLVLVLVGGAVLTYRSPFVPDWARLPSLRTVPASAGGWSGPVWRPSVVRRTTSSWRTTAALVPIEARRIVVNAGVLVVLVLTLGMLVQARRQPPHELFNSLTTTGTWLGLATFVGANAATRRRKRSGTEELEDATATDLRAQTTAQCIAVALFAVAFLLVTLVAAAIYHDHVALVRTPTFFELAQGSIDVLGGGLLGVLVGRWAPWALVTALVVVGLVMATGFFSNDKWGNDLYVFYVEYANYESVAALPPNGLAPDSAPWHALYLFAMSGMALVGAQLWHRERRRVWLGAGALVTLVTIGAGWAQLP